MLHVRIIHAVLYQFKYHIVLCIVARIPTRPVVVIKEWSTTFIAVSWTQSSTDIVDSYTIFASVINGCSNITDHEYNIHGSLREYNLTSLEVFTNYSISVMAGNHRGSSSYFTIYQKTESTSKSARITYLLYYVFLVCYCLYIEPGCCVPRPTTTTVGLTTFTATWEEEQCSIRNGLVTNYVIEYGEINTTSTTKSSDHNIRNFTAKYLFPSTMYVIKVALNNTVGVGPYVIHNITTSTPKGMPKFFQSCNSNCNFYTIMGNF